METNDDYITIGAAAKLIGITVSAVYRAISTNRLESISRYDLKLVKKEDCINLWKNNKNKKVC